MQTIIKLGGKYSELIGFAEAVPEMFRNREGSLLSEGRNVLRLFPEYGFVVKQFRKIPALNRLSYSYLRSSKAQRSFENAVLLLENGFDTPDPVAFVDLKKGLFGRDGFPMLLADSFYVCRECTWDLLSDMLESGTPERTELIIKAYVAEILAMHDCGILLVDPNPRNVFCKMDTDGVKFQYIDLNRMRISKPGRILFGMRCRCLSRIANDETMFERIASAYFSRYFNGDTEKVGQAMAICRRHRIVTTTVKRYKKTLKSCIRPPYTGSCPEG